MPPLTDTPILELYSRDVAQKLLLFTVCYVIVITIQEISRSARNTQSVYQTTSRDGRGVGWLKKGLVTKNQQPIKLLCLLLTPCSGKCYHLKLIFDVKMAKKVFSLMP